MKKKDIKEALTLNARKAAKARWKKTTKEERQEISRKMHEARYQKSYAHPTLVKDGTQDRM